MPSLSGLLKRSKTVQKPDRKAGTSDPADSSVELPAVNPDEKIQRRKSRREVFKGWLHRSSGRSGLSPIYRSNGSQSATTYTPGDALPEKPTSPMSDPNKPLPLPPANLQEAEQSRSTPVKLNRIMSPLSMADVHKMFSGAPQFFCRSEGAMSGAPWPSVAFPWNVELEIRDLGDHGQIEDQAWSCVTAAQHITRDLRISPETRQEHIRKKRGRFRPQCFERPNMVSYQGLERGTLGYSAALQLGVADALIEDVEPVGLEPLPGRRHNFLNDKNNGLRMLDEVDVASRLAELGTLYSENTSIHIKSNVEMYTELFTKVLFPPTKVTDMDDPYSLHVQIEALLQVLAVDHIWLDFSLVEWRIRLGQILWGEHYDAALEDDVSIDGEFIHEPSQKYWLLLQILLSCELLIRLDIITQRTEKNPKVISAEEAQEFDKQATVGVKWSMILARQWLENIKVEVPLVPASPEQKPAAGWLESLTGSTQSKEMTESDLPQPINFTGIHQARQFQGLIHFAKKLDWPRIDIIAGNVSQGLLSDTRNPTTPLIGTPLSMTSQRGSYFGSGNSKRPIMRRGLSKQKRMSAMIHPSGWLSKSYLTGLVLPGEGLGHLLVSTLLENDTSAIAALGEEANLYGGFMYSGKSFWSTSCVIGRILAAGTGASECMGWLSTDCMPKGAKEGWVNIDVEVAPQDVDNTPATSRIWKKSAIEKDSHVLGSAASDPTSLLPGDFTLPLPDAPSESPLRVSLLSLDLFATMSSPSTATSDFGTPSQPTPSEASPLIKTYSANMRFKVSGETFGAGSRGGHERELDMELKYDVHFVTAHPCVPSPNISLLHTPNRSNFLEGSSAGAATGAGPHEQYSGHALHKSYHFTRHHLSTLLLPHDFSTATANPLASLHTDATEIFIIDCTEPDPPANSPLSPTRQNFSTAPTSPIKSDTTTASTPVTPKSPPQRTTALPPHISALALPSHSASIVASTSVSASTSTTSLASTTGQSVTGLAAQLPHPMSSRRRRFGSDLEMLARAWCAEKGLNALISRKGRNCLACSIREAGALGWKVVLRFG